MTFKHIVLIGALACSSGCESFHQETKPVAAAEVQVLQNKYGDLPSAIADPLRKAAIIADLASTYGVHINDVAIKDGVVLVTLPPIAQEIASAGGTTIVSSLMKNLSPAGIIEGLMAAIPAIFVVIENRKKITNG